MFASVLLSLITNIWNFLEKCVCLWTMMLLASNPEHFNCIVEAWCLTKISPGHKIQVTCPLTLMAFPFCLLCDGSGHRSFIGFLFCLGITYIHSMCFSCLEFLPISDLESCSWHRSLQFTSLKNQFTLWLS